MARTSTFARRGIVVLALVVMLLVPFMSIGAQAEALPVLILPVNNANFLPGALFDFRVEVHTVAELPDNFAVTVNGTPAAEFFAAESTFETWEFGGSDTQAGTPAASVIWRDLTAPAAGDYVIEVTAGGTTETVTWTVRETAAGGARNVILFVADGMTTAMITAARAARGMEQGLPTNPLFMDSMEYVGFASTSSIDSLMADSANTASALNTGHISSVNATGVYADTSPDLLDDPRVETLAEMLQRTRDYSIGVVTTADYSDATPAAVWAHGRNRSDGNRAAYVVQSLEAGIDVLLGGGSRRLLPQSAEGSRRSDDRDMFAEFEAAGYSIATTATELDGLLTGDALPTQLLGLFNPSDLNVWLDRNVYTDNLGDLTDQPGLVDMTTAALQILNQNENGWYLEVESASPDKQIHPLDQERALSDLIEFDQAIEAAAAWVAENAPDTLIVVTSDHGHGYDVYGTVDVEEFNAGETDEERRAAIGVYNAAGYPDYPDANGDGFPEWGDASVVLAGTVNNGPDRTEDFQVSEVPRTPAIQNDQDIYVDNPDDDPNGIVQQGNLAPNSSTGVHTLQDVPVYAMGPGAELVQGSYHQREIFYVMASALSLDPSAEGGMVAVQPEVSTAGFSLSGANLALLAFGLIGGFALSRMGKRSR